MPGTSPGMTGPSPLPCPSGGGRLIRHPEARARSGSIEADEQQLLDFRYAPVATKMVHRGERSDVPISDTAPAARSKIKTPPTEAAQFVKVAIVIR